MTSRRQIGGALCCLAVLVVAASGCTIRYSQTLVGTIEPVPNMPITNSDSGFGIGLGAPQAVLTLSEPKAVNELMRLPCDVALSQSDYRGTWFSFYLTFVMPKTETVAYCVK
jgi:hypothetical protein